MHLRKRKTHCVAVVRGRTKTTSEKSSPTDIHINAEEGAGGAPDSGAEIALQPLEKPLVRQLCPLVQPVEDCGGAETHAA